MKKQLKQPHKYTHSFLKKKSESEQDNSNNERQQHPTDKQKTKQIDKDKYVRKVINKPDEPSALRLEQINKTFNNISEKSGTFIENLNINHELLKNLVNLSQKFVCDCQRNIKYYCLKCAKKCLLLNFPSIKLPLSLHIVHHAFQKISKSSVAPMKFLSEDISFYRLEGKEGIQKKQNKQHVFDKLPKAGPSTYILYPHKNSKNLKQITHKIQNLIVLDCTWFQTDQIIENMQQLGYNNYIKLEGYESVFWRYNHFGQEALSSAQSVMHFFRQYQLQNNQQPHKYDNLMLLYALNLTMVGKSMVE